MPDRARGFVKRKQGILPRDVSMAANYQAAMQDTAVVFDDAVQELILDAILASQEPQSFDPYFVSADISHVHLLTGWHDERTWLRMRSTIKGSVTRHLNSQLSCREWFVEGGSRKRVRDRAHFEYLVTTYLPRHDGWKWSREKGRHR